jgi:sugar/nucleoside kinase (ribokinase family)
MKTILCIGDAMVDVIVELGEAINVGSDTQSRISMIGGGAAANTACWLGASGAQVRFLGRVGDDPAGIRFISDLDKCGVAHGDMTTPGMSTGMVVVLVDHKGERTMFPDPGANSSLSRTDLPSLQEIGCVFISGYSLYNQKISAEIQTMMKLIREMKIPIIFDPASVGTMRNYGREKVRNILREVDVLICNRDEAIFLAGNEDTRSAAEELHHLAPTVVVKLGSDGALGIGGDHQIYHSPSSAQSVIDSTGAGDAFAAGFLPVWLEKKDLSQSLIAGNQLAGECVAILGARPRVNPR